MADISETISISGGEAVLQLLESIKRTGEASFRSLEQSTKNAGGSIERIGESIASVGEKFLLIGAAVAAAAGGFISLVASGARAAEELKNTAASVGLTIEQLQGLSFAAGQAGVEADKFVQAITRFDRAIGEAQKQSRGFANDLEDLAIKNRRAQEDAFRGLTNQEAGFGKFTKFFVDSQRAQSREIEDFNLKVARSDNVFTRLGVSVTDASGKLKSTNDVLLEVADKFKALPESAQKTADALQLVGKGGAAMIPFLNKGKAGIEEFVADLAKIAPAVTPAQAAIGEHFEEALRRTEAATTSLKNAFVATFQPGLTTFFNDVTASVVKNRQSILDLAAAITKSFGDINFGGVVDQLKALGGELKGLIPTLGEIQQFTFKDLFKGIEDTIRGIRIGLEFIKGIKIEKTGFGTFDVKFGSFEDAVNKVRAADEAVKALKPHVDDVGHAAHGAADEVKKIGTAGQAAADSATRSFVSAGARVIQLGTDLNSALKSSITPGGAKIIQIDDTQVKQEFDAIKVAAKTAADSVGTSFDDASNALRDSFVPSLRDLVTTFENTGLQIGGSFDEGISKIEETANKIVEVFTTSAKEVGDSYDQAAKDIEQVFQSIEDAAQSTADAVQQDFSGVAGNPDSGLGFASGGQVHGRPGRDKIPAWLTDREFVHNTGAVDYYGVRFMHAINRMLIPREAFRGFNLGGLVSIPTQKPLRFASGGQATSGPGLRPLSLTIGADTFAGLMAPEAVAQKLIKAATSRALNSAGRKPSGYGG